MKEKGISIKNLKFDLASGLVVFFVALSLCLGISLASTSYNGIDGLEDFPGVVIPGLIAGIIGGIVVGTYSDSRYGVSGPAASLITIVGAAIIEFGGFANGGFEKFTLAVFLGGIIQFVLGMIRAGLFAYYIPFSVIKGMLAGIGATIFIKEIPHFFGYDKDPEGDLKFTQTDGHNTFEELWLMLDNVHLGALLVAVIALAVLIIWSLKFVTNHKILSLIPGPLLAIIVAVFTSLAISGIPALNLGGEHLVNVPEPSSMEEFKGMLYFPDFSAIGDPSVWRVAFVVAIVASIASLLCVEATDKMAPEKGRTSMNRELRAQGIGNAISGLLGGLPITQVIVRSTANISAGAKSKMSAIIHGVFLLVFVLAIPGVLNTIPRAALASVLLLIGWKLASPKTMLQMIKSGWEQFIPFFAVIIVMLLTDLLIGVGTGLGIAMAIILYRNLKIAFFIKADQEDGKVHIHLSEHTTFLNKAGIMKHLDEIEDGNKVIIDLSDTVSIDFDVREALEDFVKSSDERDLEVSFIDEEKLRKNVIMGH